MAPGERLAEQLGQPVDGLLEKLRRLVRLAVPGRVERRITQPEVGRQVDDDADPVPQGRHDPLRLPVREGAEHEIEAVEAVEAVEPSGLPLVGPAASYTIPG